MKITNELLHKHSACPEGFRWVTENKLIGLDAPDFIKGLIKAEKYDWANWLFGKILNKEQAVKYAIYAAELVTDIYEKKYPNDDRPRKAIQAAKKYLKAVTKAEKNAAAYAAADAAYAAAYAAYAAYAAAAAAYAAAAYAAADAAYAAAYAAYAAAAYAAAAARRAGLNGNEIKVKILKYGLKLIS